MGGYINRTDDVRHAAERGRETVDLIVVLETFLNG
jgi:hypothetical protein